MAPVVLSSVIQLPAQIVTLVLRKLRLVPTGSAAQHSFPVAGLDESRAHAVLYALRQAALDAQVQHHPRCFISAGGGGLLHLL